MNIALARKEILPEMERLVHNKKTLNEVRVVIAQHQEVGEALVDSMQQVICTLSQRFRCMEIKGEAVQVMPACNEEFVGKEIQKNLSYENIS